MGVISVPKDTPAKALTRCNMEPGQGLVKPSEPAGFEAGREARRLWLRCGPMARRSKRPRDPNKFFDRDPEGPLPPSLSGSVTATSMTFWPVAEEVPDEAVLEIADVTPPRHGQLKRNPDGTLTYTPDPAFTGIDNFGYTLADAEGNRYPASVTVAVEPDDSGGGAGAGPEPKRKPGIVDFSHGAHGKVSVDAEGALVYTPEKGFAGHDTFSYTVVDEAGAETTARVTVEIDRSGTYRVVRQTDVG